MRVALGRQVDDHDLGEREQREQGEPPEVRCGRSRVVEQPPVRRSARPGAAIAPASTGMSDRCRRCARGPAPSSLSVVLPPVRCASRCGRPRPRPSGACGKRKATAAGSDPGTRRRDPVGRLPTWPVGTGAADDQRRDPSADEGATATRSPGRRTAGRARERARQACWTSSRRDAQARPPGGGPKVAAPAARQPVAARPGVARPLGVARGRAVHELRPVRTRPGTAVRGAPADAEPDQVAFGAQEARVRGAPSASTSPVRTVPSVGPRRDRRAGPRGCRYRWRCDAALGGHRVDGVRAGERRRRRGRRPSRGVGAAIGPRSSAGGT